MLLSFSIENWLSFLNPVCFSMIATKEQQHGERLPFLAKYKTRVLPIAAIYGGNASGKTNFFKALNFAKRLVLEGTKPDGIIPLEPYRLSKSHSEKPSRFSFVLLAGETVYEFSFAVTRKAILEEKLIAIKSSSERVLYHRQKDVPNFHKSLANDKFLKFAFQGTRENQLFLTNSVSQKVKIFQPVYDWFKNNLVLIAPDTRFELFEQFLDQEHELYPKVNQALTELDTGITRLGGEHIPFKNMPLPDFIKENLIAEVKESMSVKLLAEPVNEHYVVTRKKGELIAQKVVTYHHDQEGNEVRFEINQESDGTQRIIDLLPHFLELSARNCKKVFIVDELDRSLHTLLTKKLIQSYLQICSAESRSQLLFTTHDVLLMDQQLFRRDEMWVTERNDLGISNLFSFSEFKDVRYDKDIRKSYLQGRLGGIPRIILDPFLKSTHLSSETGKS